MEEAHVTLYVVQESTFVSQARIIYIDIDGAVAEDIWFGLQNDESGYKFGNCFRTKEEAEAASNKKIKEMLNQ